MRGLSAKDPSPESTLQSPGDKVCQSTRGVHLSQAYAPTLGLLIFLSFAPTVLINIFSLLFNFKSEVKNQLELQNLSFNLAILISECCALFLQAVITQISSRNWYFWFMVFFVIGVTVVGGKSFDGTGQSCRLSQPI
ncbi:unnamed protein product [Durusdinium trenchii]|uniref:Uncharacterized protein n=1 Tax=Durusdinium trenchii TaxID=1381693 RepID=A0ABP0MG99_9DINO